MSAAITSIAACAGDTDAAALKRYETPPIGRSSHYTTRWGTIDPHSMPLPPAGVWLSHLVKPSHAVRLGFDEQTLVLYASPSKSEVEEFFQVLGERMNAEPTDIEVGDSFDLLAWADANVGSACPRSSDRPMLSAHSAKGLTLAP